MKHIKLFEEFDDWKIEKEEEVDELVDEMPDARSTISYSLILSEQVARRWMIRATTCKAIHSGFKTSVELTDQALITSY